MLRFLIILHRNEATAMACRAAETKTMLQGLQSGAHRNEATAMACRAAETKTMLQGLQSGALWLPLLPKLWTNSKLVSYQN
jgi:hypothetical protein